MVFLVFSIIPTHLLCQLLANPPGVEFLDTISKYRKRNKISSLLIYVLHKTRNQACSRRSRAKTGREMYKKAWCTCKVVVLLKKPIVFLTFSLPSSPLDVKVPIRHSAARTLTSQFKISQTETTETTHLFFPATSLK